MSETISQSLFSGLPHNQTVCSLPPKTSHREPPAQQSRQAQTARFQGLLVYADERRPSLGTLSRRVSVQKEGFAASLHVHYLFVLQESNLLNMSLPTCSEMKVIMEMATVLKMEVRGSWRRHTMSLGCPRKSTRLRQAPIRLIRATKLRVPPEAATIKDPRCFRKTTPTDTWQMRSSTPASVNCRASGVFQDKNSKLGSMQEVLLFKDHWRSEHLVQWVSSISQKAQQEHWFD